MGLPPLAVDGPLLSAPAPITLPDPAHRLHKRQRRIVTSTEVSSLTAERWGVFEQPLRQNPSLHVNQHRSQKVRSTPAALRAAPHFSVLPRRGDQRAKAAGKLEPEPCPVLPAGDREGGRARDRRSPLSSCLQSQPLRAPRWASRPGDTRRARPCTASRHGKGQHRPPGAPGTRFDPRRARSERHRCSPRGHLVRGRLRIPSRSHFSAFKRTDDVTRRVCRGSTARPGGSFPRWPQHRPNCWSVYPFAL